jgi:hypothetical protein
MANKLWRRFSVGSQSSPAAEQAAAAVSRKLGISRPRPSPDDLKEMSQRYDSVEEIMVDEDFDQDEDKEDDNEEEAIQESLESKRELSEDAQHTDSSTDSLQMENCEKECENYNEFSAQSGKLAEQISQEFCLRDENLQKGSQENAVEQLAGLLDESSKREEQLTKQAAEQSVVNSLTSQSVEEEKKNSLLQSLDQSALISTGQSAEELKDQSDDNSETNLEIQTAEKCMDQSADEIVESSSNQLAKQPLENTVEKSAQHLSELAVCQSTDQPVNESTKQSVTQSVEQSQIRQQSEMQRQVAEQPGENLEMASLAQFEAETTESLTDQSAGKPALQPLTGEQGKQLLGWSANRQVEHSSAKSAEMPEGPMVVPEKHPETKQIMSNFFSLLSRSGAIQSKPAPGSDQIQDFTTPAKVSNAQLNQPLATPVAGVETQPKHFKALQEAPSSHIFQGSEVTDSNQPGFIDNRPNPPCVNSSAASKGLEEITHDPISNSAGANLITSHSVFGEVTKDNHMANDSEEQNDDGINESANNLSNAGEISKQNYIIAFIGDICGKATKEDVLQLYKADTLTSNVNLSNCDTSSSEDIFLNENMDKTTNHGEESVAVQDSNCTLAASVTRISNSAINQLAGTCSTTEHVPYFMTVEGSENLSGKSGHDLCFATKLANSNSTIGSTNNYFKK